VDYRIYLNLLSYRWTQEILTALSDHPRRYTEILHAISPAPSPKVLSESLIRLQEHSLIQRRPGEDSAPYDLTDAGYALLRLAGAFLDELRRWGEEYVPAA
jgi:DNA-binding HxlR family transcriptional regulator